MRRIKEEDLVKTKEGRIGMVEQDSEEGEEDLDATCLVDFPNFSPGYYVKSELELVELSEQEYKDFVKSIKEKPVGNYEWPANDLYIPIPSHKEFLIIWKQFRDMSKNEGFVKELLSSEDSEGLDWDRYFYRHHYQQIGQTLLEYCINCSFPDVHCTSHPEVTRFGMTAFQLEPEMDSHDEEKGIIRRATEIEVLHFSGVRNTEDLEEELTEMLSTGGFLKILVAIPEGDIEDGEYKHHFKKEITSWYEVNEEKEDVEYILLIPKIEAANILWEYLVLDYKGEEINSGKIE